MTDFPDLKIKALVNFPANAIGGAGIDIETVNGNFVVDLDYADFAPPVYNAAGRKGPVIVCAVVEQPDQFLFADADLAVWRLRWRAGSASGRFSLRAAKRGFGWPRCCWRVAP